MPKIIIEDISNVIIDGKNCDDIFSACDRFPELAAEIQEATTLWSMRVACAEKRATAAESALAEITHDRDRLAALLAEASAAFDAGDIATLTTMRAAALQTENEKKLAAALARKAEAEAEIAALEA